jgi:hypothetical protein
MDFKKRTKRFFFLISLGLWLPGTAFQMVGEFLFELGLPSTFRNILTLIAL